MQVCNTKALIREVRAEYRGTVALVPTMGYLHDGHLELVRQARLNCDNVIVTIFVNPTQFGPNEDLSKYPRDLKRDLDMLRAAGVDAVFTPTPDEMYVNGNDTVIESKRLSRMLIGRIRPGHFQGVTTVVAKLFNICQPDSAFFGEKDYQQLQVIKRMVRDLDIPVTVVGVPTVREADGVAMSSRNVMLTPPHRVAAVSLNKALTYAQDVCTAPRVTTQRLRREITQILAAQADASVQSVDIRDAETLAPVRGYITRPVVALLAVRFGKVLLIDQRVIGPLV